MEYPNSFINNLPKIRELSLGVINSLPLPEKEINTLEKLPNDFLKNYPILQSFLVSGLSYYECKNSVRNRLGAQKRELNVDFLFSYGGSCVTLDGTIDLSSYENELCSIGETMQTVLDINDGPAFYRDTHFFLTRCVSPNIFSLSTREFSFMEKLILDIENVEYLSEKIFVTKEDETIFLSIKYLQIFDGNNLNLTEGLLGNISFSKLESLYFWNTHFRSVHSDALSGNEKNLIFFFMLRGTTGNLSVFWEKIIPKFHSKEMLTLSSSGLTRVPEGIPTFVNLSVVLLTENEIDLIETHKFALKNLP
eukprot:snap_masked-scaffold_13-processed-gene-6.24-mRNA-1 protein AED:1.00 eAED:1.00 QI:0/0/0/0/1/1/2/0/306